MDPDASDEMIDHLVDFFDRIAPSYDSWAGGQHERVAARLVEWASPQKGEHVLDVGTGTGLVAHLVAPRVSPGTVIGIDLSDHMLAIARSKRTKNVQFLGMAAEQLVFKPETFDLVTMGEALAYLSDPTDALAEAHRVLRPGGRLAVASPALRRAPRGPPSAASRRPPRGVESAAKPQHSRAGPLLPGARAPRPPPLPAPSPLQLGARAPRRAQHAAEAPRRSGLRGDAHDRESHRRSHARRRRVDRAHDRCRASSLHAHPRAWSALPARARGGGGIGDGQPRRSGRRLPLPPLLPDRRR